MQKKEVIEAVQMFRGNQGMILAAFLLSRIALSVEDLEEYTGLHNDTVRRCVKHLVARELICKQKMNHGKQVFIPAGQSFFGQLFVPQIENEKQISQSPRTSDSALYDDDVDESEESQENKSSSSIIKRQSPRTSDSAFSEEQKLCLAELKNAGVIGKKACDLAQLEWVTVEYIRAQVEEAKAGVWNNVQAGIVWLIENESPVQGLAEKKNKQAETKNYFREEVAAIAEFWDSEHEDDCDCVQCKQQHPERYCIHRQRLHNRYNHVELLSGECGYRVVEGSQFCERHLQK